MKDITREKQIQEQWFPAGSLNFEEMCHAFITALFRLQDRWTSRERDEDGKLHQKIEGTEGIYICRTDKTIRLSCKCDDSGYAEDNHYIRMGDPTSTIPMILLQFLMIWNGV